jgi:hypothetical protein
VVTLHVAKHRAGEAKEVDAVVAVRVVQVVAQPFPASHP